MITKEMIEKEVHASQRREGRLREIILRQLDGAEKVAEAVQDMMDAVDCSVCMLRPANTTLPCGHCFCCEGRVRLSEFHHLCDMQARRSRSKPNVWACHIAARRSDEQIPDGGLDSEKG